MPILRMGEIMKRLFAGAVAALTVAALFLPIRVQAISAQKVVVLDTATERILYGKESDSRSLIASTTKIMTGYIVARRCNVLDRFRIPKEAVGIEGSSMYLQEGEVLTVQELLYGLMLHSGNDAAVALAIYCAGTVEGFVDLMNETAISLGLSGTHFANPHGLDAPEHYSTAEDLAKLAAAAMEEPVFAMTVSTKTVQAGNRYLRNHNKLLWRLEGADGVKTGYTKAAGRILVSSACREGRRLIGVTINAADDWNDHKVLLERAFREFSLYTVVSEGEVLGVAEVSGGDCGYVELIAGEEFVYPLTSDEKVTLQLPGIGFVYAPVSAGQRVGKANIYVNDHCVGSVEVIFGATVEQESQKERSFIRKWTDRLFGKGEVS